MKIFGILFLGTGILIAIDGFANLVTDIQFGIGVMGIAIAGIGIVLVYLSTVKDELQLVYMATRRVEE
jgi:divalent metal cation (Fe/Co/Zn/Cd) transporter